MARRTPGSAAGITGIRPELPGRTDEDAIPTNIAQNAARRNLAQLNRMRWIAVAGQLLAIWGRSSCWT
ncbi:hypothetical protein FLP41_15655 [Paracoccus marcusii]|uniref:hypothetical protein n=1 Tax=Paracoccus marcusii TaxID=59779 RepID=UPI0012F25284|nr:hypothetical protein FLP41_15655 [Paracoccus marcusii]